MAELQLTAGSSALALSHGYTPKRARDFMRHLAHVSYLSNLTDGHPPDRHTTLTSMGRQKAWVIRGLTNLLTIKHCNSLGWENHTSTSKHLQLAEPQRPFPRPTKITPPTTTPPLDVVLETETVQPKTTDMATDCEQSRSSTTDRWTWEGYGRAIELTTIFVPRARPTRPNRERVVRATRVQHAFEGTMFLPPPPKPLISPDFL